MFLFPDFLSLMIKEKALIRLKSVNFLAGYGGHPNRDDPSQTFEPPTFRLKACCATWLR